MQDTLASGSRKIADTAEDKDMIRLAAQLTRDLNTPRPGIYWPDFLGSAILGYAALAGALMADGWAQGLLCAAVAILALYRAGSFIHELTHLKNGALPGFKLVWNMLIGVPLLVPSFLYEGIHSLHHSRTRYGTADDPEYLPLALMKPWTVPLFLTVGLVAPLGLLLRFGVLAPLSMLIPPFRATVVERYSGLIINPDFRRKPASGALGREWRYQELAASVWAMTIIAAVATGFVSFGTFAIVYAVLAGVLTLNQVRTLVAHRWENDGAVLSITGQYLDSVNVPPPSVLPVLWAPVGLRFHALHHLLPGLPYHALAEAHGRLMRALPEQSVYGRANYTSLPALVLNLFKGSQHRPE